MQQANDVENMRVQPDFRIEQMRTLAKAGQRRGNHGMTRDLKLRRDVAPTPAAKPGTWDEQEGGHPSPRVEEDPQRNVTGAVTSVQ